VSACFSKGLGAPVGSVVAGTANFVERARRMRQMLGGGVRQGGVLAAAGLVALDRIGELAADHDKARRLASGLLDLGWEVNTPETNIVLARVADIAVTLESLRAVGVLALPMAGKVRFIAHRDLSMADIDETLRRIKAGGHP
jgi:threonine aldolase